MKDLYKVISTGSIDTIAEKKQFMLIYKSEKDGSGLKVAKVVLFLRIGDTEQKESQ